VTSTTLPSRSTKGKEQQGPEVQTTPRMPETLPPPMPSGDYSYTLEIVMNMQNSLGKLTEAVDGLKTRQAEQATKLDRMSHQIYAAIVVIVVFGAILTFFAKSINDAITSRVLGPAVQQSLPK
jgi:hypothetical protein